MHYDERYFQKQKAIGELGGQANLFMFRKFVNPSDTVLDFGCGGGYVLKNLHCRRRIGVEINPSAREVARSQGVEVYESVQQLPEQHIDIAISNHALEHVLSPWDTLHTLRQKLKDTALVVFVVPHDCKRQVWRANDPNMHLYTWNRMTLGNLFVSAGYVIDRVDAIHHCWPPCSERIFTLAGEKWHHRLGYVEAWRTGRSQVRIVARPDNEPDATTRRE